MLPIKINRAPKKSFPLIRNNYKKYSNATWDWIQIFNTIELLKSTGMHSYLRIIATENNITYSTLKDKYNKWKNNNKPTLIEDNRGSNNRLFTKEQELELFNYLKETYIDKEKYLDDTYLKEIAIKKWISLYPDDINSFKASNGWIYDFKLRWKLSSLTASYSRKASNVDENKIIEFVKVCKIIKETIDKSFIFNMDETNWKSININKKVIGITGSEHRKVTTNINLKSGFTCIFIISADGKFLNPIVIIKGKTYGCLKKINAIDNALIHKKFSENGWINIEIMKFVLNEISKITKDKKSILILDEYSVHIAESIKEEAIKLSIQLVYIPPGKTSTLQPLDVSINGAIKSVAKKLDKKLLATNPSCKPSILNSIKTMIESKNKIKEVTIINSFIKATIL